MRTSLSVLMLSACLLHAPSLASQATPYDRRATCASRDGHRIDIGRLSISLTDSFERRRNFYTIDRNYVIIGSTPDRQENVLIYDVLFLVRAQSTDNLLVFNALLDGRRYIYWIEKQASEGARHGLLTVDGERITPYCEGSILR